MIDTHSHIDGPEFQDDLSEVVQRAKEAGVKKILVPNINEQTIDHLLQVCADYSGYLFPMIGLHPEEVNPTQINVEQALNHLSQRLSDHPQHFVAIGEVGLDLYWETTYKDLQIQVLKQQIEWTIDFQLPLMIHCRKAHGELMEIIDTYRDKHLTGVFHCFTGTADEAKDMLRHEGFMLGIGGVATFKKSKLPQVLLDAVPLSRIVLETDAPYMAPVPYRGKRNESAFVVEVAKKLSEVYQTSLEEISQQTTANVNSVFMNLKQN